MLSCVPLCPVTPMGSGVIFQPGLAASSIVEPSGSSLPESPGFLGLAILRAAALGHRNLGSRALCDWSMGSSRRNYSLVSRRLLLGAQPSDCESCASVCWMVVARPRLSPHCTRRFRRRTHPTRAESELANAFCNLFSRVDTHVPGLHLQRRDEAGEPFVA